ncbi:hypothetical protein B0H15DRAFT_301274 [Mycena belliarum]|uniref:Pentatricopeptide repeat-containing protein n=1 Tax=Mycena belliarum TaxID=1033014 RepID=A0AAD6U417_9AGAR|nr:hypothetical protein B0H15DRAFT_301274 [Mycena belliae]
MIRASSLAAVLAPVRFARLTPIQSVWTKASNLPSEDDDDAESPKHRSYITSDSTSSAGSSQAGSTESLVGTSRVGDNPLQNPLCFRLPDPAPGPSYVPLYFVRQQTRAYPVGKSWRKLPVPIIHPKIIKHGQPFLAGHGEAPFYDDTFHDLDLRLLFDVDESNHIGVDRVAWRRDLLRVLGNTQSHQQAWKAYYTLVSVPFTIPHRHLKRLVRLLARETTKTRAMFGRLLSVLTSIHESGWKIEAYQWNALVDNAGKGLRKARPEDFRLAFDMFTDMVSAKPVGSALSTWGYSLDEEIADNPLPNIITYTTLVNHAAESRSQAAVQTSTSLLTASGISPNRITHLALLKYYSGRGQLDGVRASLLKMRQQGFELGLDGLHACMWAFSRHLRADVAMKIYRILRHNKSPEVHIGPDDVYSAMRSLLEEGIEVRPDMVANELTYSTTIQIMAYHGHLNAALTAFMDMLSSDNVEIGAPLYRDEHGILKPSPYSPTLPIFRGIFLGFFRHGVAKQGGSSSQPQPWVLGTLNSLFDVFLALPEPAIMTGNYCERYGSASKIDLAVHGGLVGIACERYEKPFSIQKRSRWVQRDSGTCQ